MYVHLCVYEMMYLWCMFVNLIPGMKLWAVRRGIQEKINLFDVSRKHIDGDELNVKFSFAWLQEENAISSVSKSVENREIHVEHVIEHKLDLAI